MDGDAWVGRLIRVARLGLKLTQGQLATMLRTSPSRVSKLERGQAAPYADELVTVVQLLATRRTR